MAKKKKICPFLSFGAKEGMKECQKDGCELWVYEVQLKGTVGCAFRALAARLNTIEEHLGAMSVKSTF
jgi:hypothetical protein